MVVFLNKLAKWIGSLNEGVGRAVSWLTTVLVVLVCFDVITRYLANDTKAWIMELEWHLFALIFLLGAGFAFRHDRHVRVDLFYARFSRRDQALVNLLGGVLFLLPWAFTLIVVSLNYGLDAYRIGETSPDPGGLPARYLIKLAIPVGLTLLLLQGIANIIESALVLAGRDDSESDDKD